jgi:hypothetical protein
LLFYLPPALFVLLIVANFFADYVSWKAAGICVLIFAASFLLPPPGPTVVASLLDVGLLIKFKAEYL